MADEPKIWSIYSREDRLILALSDEPGVFNFARAPADDMEPLECAYATLQCYDPKAEAEILDLMVRSTDLEDFLDRLHTARFKIREGRPRPSRFARL